jgi:hypothetical protein
MRQRTITAAFLLNMEVPHPVAPVLTLTLTGFLSDFMYNQPNGTEHTPEAH